MQPPPATPWNRRVATAFIAALIRPTAPNGDVSEPIDDAAQSTDDDRTETGLSALDKVAS